MTNGNGSAGVVPTWLVKAIIAFLSTLLVVTVTVIITVLQAIDTKITIIDEQQDSIIAEQNHIQGELKHIKARSNRISIRQLEVFKQLVNIYRDTGLIDKHRFNKKLIEAIQSKDIDEEYKQFFKEQEKEMIKDANN